MAHAPFEVTQRLEILLQILSFEMRSDMAMPVYFTPGVGAPVTSLLG